jgi:hypothetical protein
MAQTTRAKITTWRQTLTRDKRVFVVLYLNLDGREYWFAHDRLSIESTDRNILISIDPGLSTDVEITDSIDIGLREGTLQSVGVSIWNKERFQDLRDSMPLTKGRAEISLWLEGLTWEERLILLDGYIRSPSWGDSDDTFDFEVLPKQFFMDRDFPNLQIDTTRFPNASDSAIGDPYPVIYGDAKEVKCPYVDTVNHKYLIAGHECYAVPSKVVLVGYNGISKQEVFSSDCSSLDHFSLAGDTWTTTGNVITFTRPAGDDGEGSAYFIDSDDNRIQAYNFIARTTTRFDTDVTEYIGFWIRRTGTLDYYLARIYRVAGGDLTWQIAKRTTADGFIAMASGSAGTIAVATWFDLRVRVDGNRITIFKDGTELGAAEDNSFPRSADVGLYCHVYPSLTASASVSFDGVRFPVNKPIYSLTTDGEDNTVYLVDFYEGLGEDTDVYVDVQGKKNSNGNLIENPAEVVKDIVMNYTDLGSTGVDLQSFGDAETKLNGWKFASIFQGSGVTKGTTFSTISQRLTKQLPLLPLWKENLYSIEYISYDREDVSAYLIRGRNIIDLRGRIKEGPLEDIANVFKIKYGYSAIKGRFTKYMERNSSNSTRCSDSKRKYGEREYPTLECYDIQDDATAIKFLDFLERTYTEVPVLVSYECTKDQAYLDVNAIVAVTDPDQAWDDKKFLIERVEYLEESVIFNLRSLE